MLSHGAAVMCSGPIYPRAVLDDVNKDMRRLNRKAYLVPHGLNLEDNEDIGRQLLVWGERVNKRLDKYLALDKKKDYPWLTKDESGFRINYRKWLVKNPVQQIFRIQIPEEYKKSKLDRVKENAADTVRNKARELRADNHPIAAWFVGGFVDPLKDDGPRAIVTLDTILVPKVCERHIKAEIPVDTRHAPVITVETKTADHSFTTMVSGDSKAAVRMDQTRYMKAQPAKQDDRPTENAEIKDPEEAKKERRIYPV